ncbi:MAG: hypothetical protein P8X92_06790, partial [Dehalococcoidia bacterium]
MTTTAPSGFEGLATTGQFGNRTAGQVLLAKVRLSCVVAALFYRFMPETKPEAEAEQAQQSIFQTFKGYGVVTR